MIRVEREEAVAVVTVERPEAMNALDVATLTELRDRLLELRDDADVRVVVLTGAGDRAFIAGADIKAMSAMDVEQAKAWGALGHEAATLLETIPKPTVAAINGFALGGGCELALACDIRYASPAAKLGQPEINLGIVPGWGGTQRLARVCGLGFAKELILTGRVVGADGGTGARTRQRPPRSDPSRKPLETARLLASKSPAGARRGEGGDERRAPGRPRGEPRGRGRSLRRPLRERGREGGPDRLHREARPDVQRALGRTFSVKESSPLACVGETVPPRSLSADGDVRRGEDVRVAALSGERCAQRLGRHLHGHPALKRRERGERRR